MAMCLNSIITLRVHTLNESIKRGGAERERPQRIGEMVGFTWERDEGKNIG